MDYENVLEQSYLSLDPIRVKQIIMNLTSNAIKFTPNGGMIRILISHVATEADMECYTFRIQDSGVGMSSDFIKNNLYQIYAQENNSVSDQYAGSGLGLAITKNIVELMGGSIDVESEIGEGTTFTVKLRFLRVTPKTASDSIKEQSKKTDELRHGLDGKKILLAEDHSLNAEIVIRMLKREGCNVVWANNGKLAVEEYISRGAGYYDAVLMDIRMPVMNGIDATKTIRSSNMADARNIPIIALSANAYDEDVKLCMDAGMNEHLSKPINPQRLYEELIRLIDIYKR